MFDLLLFLKTQFSEQVEFSELGFFQSETLKIPNTNHFCCIEHLSTPLGCYKHRIKVFELGKEANTHFFVENIVPANDETVFAKNTWSEILPNE